MKKKIKRIYLAGALSGDISKNVSIAIVYADKLFKMGLFPFVPHLNQYWHMRFSQPYEKWMEYDFVWLRQCEALFRIPGVSPGADKEVALAKELGIPIFYTFKELKKFLKS